jgi:hypothetical protein
MAPSLYAADAFVGKPKKIHETPADAKEGSGAAASPENGSSKPKPKRVVSEETKAKLREAQQRRKQERLEAERTQNEQEESARREQEASAAAAQAKKAAAAQKRKEARLKRKQTSEGTEEQEDAGSAASSGATSQGSRAKATVAQEEPPAAGQASQDGQAAQEVQAPPAKKQRKEGNGSKAALKKKPRDPSNGDAPPAWFNKFVGAMMHEKNEQQGIRVNKKHLKEAANQEAESRWRDGYTRERVRATVDDHVSRMYGMIFG